DTLYLRIQGSYGGAVAYLDAGIGQLLDVLRQRGWLDQLAVVFTSDRGLALGEHGFVGASPLPHNEAVHLPLIMRLPGAEWAGRRVAALTQAVDLAPTLAELLGR